jgi:large subunit ribosomal protein L24
VAKSSKISSKKQASAKQMSLRTSLKRGDSVMVISGGNKKKRPLKGQVAKIRSIVGARGDRVVLEGLNTYVRNRRPTSPTDSGGKVTLEKSVHISNVMYYAEKAQRPVRLVKKVLEDGSRIRGFKDPVTNEFIHIDGSPESA